MTFERQLIITGISSATVLIFAVGGWMANSIHNLENKSNKIHTDLEVVKYQVVNLNEKFDKYIDRTAVIPLLLRDNYASLKEQTKIPEEPHEKF